MTSASAAAAANFAPYQPPPDHNSSAHGASSASSSQGRPPVPPPTQQEPRQYRDDAYAEEDDVEDDPRYATESYQSGSLGTSQQQQYRQAPYQPTHQQSAASSYQPASSWQTPYPSQTQPDHASYVTSQGISISNLCYAAWALPPFSGVGVLIFETNNDLVRFHAYQSALCGVIFVILLYILRSWFGWYTLSVIAGMGALGAAWVAGHNAARAAPTLAKMPYLPHIGPLAEEWVGNE